MFRVVLSSLLLALSLAAAEAQTVILVRHAEKAEATGAGANDPEISQAGQQRAEKLARLFQDANLTAVFATEYKRTQQTARRVADLARTEVTVVPAKETTKLVEKLKELRGNGLVVGHSNTLPEIIAALGAPEAVKIDESDYGNLFIWSPATKQLLRLHLP